MSSTQPSKMNLPSVLLVLGVAAVAAPHGAVAAECQNQETGITLSPGFCATVFADNLGHVRQMTVSSDNVVYANTWSGRYYHNDTPPAGGFLLALKDTSGSGKADVVKRFGPDKAAGAAGGTGIALYNGALYAELNDKIVSYARAQGEIVPAGQPKTVLSGMPLTGDHPMHPFAIDAKGNLFVDLGSATNACQDDNRMPLSPGHNPCTELETRAGIWRYDANKAGQTFSAAARYATGIRNGEGFGFDKAGRLFVTQHGRDQLSQNWPKLYSVDQGVELPAEELLELKQGGDYGWPECYYDQSQKKLVLAPEYGGDGGKTVGVCADKEGPVAAFPGHWAPNDLLIYTGTQFPEPYRDGAFIAFHGSWNRAPRAQAGYNVVFQPMSDGKAAGDYVVFADGFAGAHKDPGRAAFRPSGLAMGPDGALYISDDVHGRIWRVTYRGDAATARVAAAPAPAAASGAAGAALPPEGTHADAGRATPDLPVPPDATKDQVALGDRIFHGEADNGTCSGCHGSDAKGTSVGPDLTNGIWVWGDGSLGAITKTVTDGVPRPRNYTGVMPPKGGAQLSDADVAAVSAYVWAIGHTK
ncbi:c-type cytochrome [Bradyrhizobium erythrophlei]|uniref:Glucose/arabinose dehydrogenase, beta-propeller fold n=1 Tax=Bradyrhizobium erythrophlei TaxID=1437360 RepID=A0A1M7U5Q7_9BRAD|nr:c-type cytochrome [Bradyrhizobium erythrophlei]SHN78235.1 Glucose/arabinose dehydrogenase, beta-propeller fold [Bradyrhizobium erythrophlei]